MSKETGTGGFVRAPGAEKYKRKKGEPLHSRHVAEVAEKPSAEETAENGATLIQDGIAAFEWLAQDNTRSLIGQDWTTFARERGWTRGHRHEVAELVRTELVFGCMETAEQTRARITVQAQEICRDARLSGDYSPAVAALKLQADILLPKETEKHLHVHQHADDMSEKPESELIEIVKRAKLNPPASSDA